MATEPSAIYELLFSEYIEKFNYARDHNVKFVHYTSADTLCKILNGKAVWLRNTRCMNDYSEIDHGINAIVKYFGTEKAVNFWNLIDKKRAGLSAEIKKRFDDIENLIWSETFIACVSEHDKLEDNTGKLSMWRAYAPEDGVALVLNPQALLNEAGDVGANTFPVFYFSESEIETHFNLFIEKLSSFAPLIDNIDENTIVNVVMEYFEFMTFSLKHPAFKEEKEWRIVYRAWKNNSDFVQEEYITVRGVPQRIFKFPLRNDPAREFFGADPAELIERVIVGPTENFYVIADSLRHHLTAAGVENAASIIINSSIPIRKQI